MDLAETRMKPAYSAPRPWRQFATGLSFAYFGIGGLLLRVLVFPLLGLFARDARDHRRLSRLATHRTFRAFVNFMYRSGVLTYQIEGAERLGRPGQLVIANHPSLIDVVVLISVIPDANCIVKQSLWHNPFTRGPIRAAQYISNSGSMDMLEEAADALREGQTLIVFPEGTRTTPGKPPEFHRGAASIALRGASMITPVIIRVEPTTLTKAEPWYSVPSRRFHFHLRVGQDIDPRQFTEQGPLPVASRKLNDCLHNYYTKELASDERSAT